MIVVMAVIKCDRDRQGTNMYWRKSRTAFRPEEIVEQGHAAT